MHPIAYLTAELTSRDLDSRILIARHLLKAGITAVVGQQWGLGQARHVALKGCYLFKTANHIQAKEMAGCRAHGHLVVACDEEALPIATDMLLDNIAPETFDHSHLFLAQNETHRKIIAARYPGADDHIRVTGNPRLDLLATMKHGFQEEARRIRADVGPYILFNTGFALTNSVWGNTDTALARMSEGVSLDVTKGAASTQFRERLEAEVASRAQLVELLRHCMTSLPKHRIVVRPHPSEGLEQWNDIARQTDRVLVVSGTAAAPWILGADCMIHSDSTTGLEAAILGASCINVSPVEAWSANFLMRRVNCTVPTAESAFKMLEVLVKSGQDIKTDIQSVLREFPAQAARNMANHIAELLRQHGAKGNQIGAIDWVRSPLTGRRKEKFSVSPDEFDARIKAIFGALDPIKFGVLQLDDSVFMLFPG